MTSDASDGGQVEFVESAITAFKDEVGRDTYTWAVAVKNTSATDVLVYATYEKRFTYAESEDDFGSWSVYALLPGQTTYQGNNTSGGAAPTTMTPVVTEARWLPMTALAEQGLGAGAELIRGELDRGDGKVTANVSYTSHGLDATVPIVDLLVVFRDKQGKLLGAMLTEESERPMTPGVYELETSFESTDWLPGADAAKSAATISVSCCKF